MYDPAVDLLIQAVAAKEPYEIIMEKINHGLLPYIKEITKGQRLAVLQEKVKRCKKCGLCHDIGDKAMPEGNPYAEIMLIGEAAGEQEVLQSRCFVGPAGQLLDTMLDAASKNIDIRFNRKNLYISNVVKGRPMDAGKNRKPTKEELIACYEYIKEEIELVNPKLILCLGGTAAEMIIHPEFQITRDIGKFYGNGRKMVAIYHPSYLLHLGEGSAEQIKAKNECWNVLKDIDKYFKEEVD